MNIDPYAPANVQYGDWLGSIAGDEADMLAVEEFLGVDRNVWRLIHINITMSGGTQWIAPYVISAATTYADLEATVESDEAIQLTLLESIEYHPRNHSDTNPPRPSTLPIVSATDFLGYGFKRLVIKLTTRSIPAGARFEFVELPNPEDSE